MSQPRTGPTTLVFGPAYLDRVLRVDRPLVDRGFADRPLDGSVDGSWVATGTGLIVVDPLDNRLVIDLPAGWPGPSGTVRISRPLAENCGSWSRTLSGIAWQDDLGGMGAGYAVALGGDLISALGPESDPTSVKISALLDGVGVSHHPIRVKDHPSDWTLLVTSGEHGDKLPIGFRGCHASVNNQARWLSQPSQVRVVASLPNRLASEAFEGPSLIRFFAPSLRNMIDRNPPVSSFAHRVDILSCNRGEWEQLDDRDQVAAQVSILVVTDGPNGATLHHTTPQNEPNRVSIPAFPRTHPPQDTNRAGEAFGSTLLLTLLEAGWTPGPTSTDLIHRAGSRAAVAAALVLDRLDFGFPTQTEIDEALRVGRVG